MKYFVFRNTTVELLFSGIEAEYSGYGDILTIPPANRYIWFYMVPYNVDINSAAQEVLSYGDWLELVLAALDRTKMVIALKIVDTFSVCSSIVNPLHQAIDSYNKRLEKLTEKYNNLRLINLSNFLINYSCHQWVDWKYYFLSQASINPRLATDFRIWFASQIRVIELKRKKCLVLDLDNTLWGGILGEDGIEKIQLGIDYPGSAYLAFQKYILQLAQSGVILTICSKNNEEEVLTMWQRHPSNIINTDHLAAYRINWKNKADNIRELADELNIGMDSMVFIDDNPSERELVKRMLPEVEVPEFPEHPYLLPEFIRQITENYFKVYILTEEDKTKTKQYKAKAKREREKENYLSFDDYLKSLEIELSIAQVTNLTIERAAQMTQKTNQFNLTTHRYTQDDIQAFLNRKMPVYTLRVSDKFGDNGITALMIIDIKDQQATIDTLLMSCRVLGKQIEFEFVKYVLNDFFKNYKVDSITAYYLPTLKNVQVADFYDRVGFENLGHGRYFLDKSDFTYIPNNLYSIRS